MEGVTDIVFRQVVAKAARPDLFFTEFTNASSYVSEKGRANALERLKITPSDLPIIAQIWGKNPTHFSDFIPALKTLGFAGVDLNMGCPDKNVVKTGGGSALIKTPNLAVEIIKASQAAAPEDFPISVKTRLGYSKIDEYKTWLPTLLSQNLAALTVHLRTKKEMSKVPAHFELIPEILKLRAEIAPTTHLIINGDVRDKSHAEELWRTYPEINGIMIGRGVFANPYCFSDHVPTQAELFVLLNYHLDLFDDAESPNPFSQASTPARFEPLKRFFKVYINNFPGASDLRASLMTCKTTSEVRDILYSWTNS
jgi:tRNA-dihydrouridine synthase